MECGAFDYVVATKFLNYNNSVYEKLFDWNRLETEDDRKLCRDFENYADVVVEKTVYTCVNSHFLQRICQLNDGVFPEKLFLAGADTDCCVLKIAADLFENNIRPVVLTNYCDSNGGPKSHLAGIACLKRLIGKKQLFSGEIKSKEDLLSI
ncbi:MAG: cysteine hydrolase [Ruminococcus sp.]|nr:cysteine hydrolase [Ruminococcus sp.]